MMHKKNKGVTMVEVLIALAIFTVMMIPLVSSIMSGMKTTTSAKETQNRNEYARNLMESVKEVPISVLKDTGKAEQFFEDMGSKNVMVTKATHTYNGTMKQSDYEVYNITGTTYLGVERKEYVYAIEVSNEEYAIAEGDGLYDNPNNLTSIYVESLDENDVAFISAPYANHDTPAFDALLTMKLAEMRKRCEQNTEEFDSAKQVLSFRGDRGRRNIHITVDGNINDGYDIACTLKYSDNNTTVNVGTVDYTPYAKHFDVLPNIYLMYNVCVYNGQYADDYITFDVLENCDATEVNAFVIATAETAIDDDNVDSKKIYKQDVNLGPRENLNIGFGAESSEDAGKVKVYHNFTNASAGSSIYGGENTLSIADTALMNSIFGISCYNIDDVELYDKSQEDRGLYKISIRMREATGNTNDILLTDPVLEGARGGDEID